MTVFQHLSEIAARGYSFQITAGPERTINVAIFDQKGNVDGFQIENSFIYGGEYSQDDIKDRITRSLKRLEKK